MAKEVVNSFVYRDVSAEIVKANGRFSFSITGTHGERHIRHCAYCYGQWVSSQEKAETIAKEAIDGKIAGTFRPFIAHKPPPKPASTVAILSSQGGKKYGVPKKIKKDG